MRTTTCLRELLSRPGVLVLPGAYDALSAADCAGRFLSLLITALRLCLRV